MSNSTNHGRGYLEHALTEVVAVLAGRTELLFVPYALADHDRYTARVAEALEPLGIAVRGAHTTADPGAAIRDAQAVFVGGGNTFRLLKTLQGNGGLDALRDAARSGTPYLGASAGTGISAPTIRTTNDMPITEPATLSSLGLVPFQLNPHFVDADPASTHMGETRETRLREFLEVNDVAVLGLREGTWLRVSDQAFTVGGTAVSPTAPGPAVVLRRSPDGSEPQVEEVAGDVSALAALPARYDV